MLCDFYFAINNKSNGCYVVVKQILDSFCWISGCVNKISIKALTHLINFPRIHHENCTGTAIRPNKFASGLELQS